MKKPLHDSTAFTSPIGTDGREACPNCWTAVCTRPRSEKKLAAELARQGVEVYVPSQMQMHTWSDRRKLVETIVIPMTVFVRVADSALASIRRNPLVLQFVAYPGKREPARIPDEQIRQLRYVLGQSDIPVTFNPGLITSQDKVRVARGQFMGLCGKVTEARDGSVDIMVEIDCLGGARLTISRNDLETV